MKLIMDGAIDGSVRIASATPRTMAALTNGGYGELPGDAVTIDLAEDEGRRVAVATAMPMERARDNMVRAGHEPGFVDRWLGALLEGGQTEASALELVRQKTFPKGEQVAIDPSEIPGSRFLREAWRRKGDGIIVDLNAGRLVFARRLISAKREAAARLTDEIEAAALAGGTLEALDAAYSSLRAIDLKVLGSKIASAKSSGELMSLWPVGLSV